MLKVSTNRFITNPLTSILYSVIEEVIDIYLKGISSIIKGEYGLGGVTYCRDMLEGVSNNEYGLEGVTYCRDMLEGVSNKEYNYRGFSNKEYGVEGVSNNDLGGVNNTTDLRGVNNTTDLRGVSNTTDLRGVNNTTDLRGVSNTTDLRGVSNVIKEDIFEEDVISIIGCYYSVMYEIRVLIDSELDIKGIRDRGEYYLEGYESNKYSMGMGMCNSMGMGMDMCNSSNNPYNYTINNYNNYNPYNYNPYNYNNYNPYNYNPYNYNNINPYNNYNTYTPITSPLNTISPFTLCSAFYSTLLSRISLNIKEEIKEWLLYGKCYTLIRERNSEYGYEECWYNGKYKVISIPYFLEDKWSDIYICGVLVNMIREICSYDYRDYKDYGMWGYRDYSSSVSNSVSSGVSSGVINSVGSTVSNTVSNTVNSDPYTSYNPYTNPNPNPNTCINNT
ncbi:hypothetical protein CWI39_3203p0010, partial [Hamiltosporidium magnivora]